MPIEGVSKEVDAFRLVTIPLKTNYTLPYGLMYANEPTAAAKKFICAIKEI